MMRRSIARGESIVIARRPSTMSLARVRGTASQSERRPRPSPGPKSADPTINVARCFLHLAIICRATRSSDLAGISQSFGARPAKSCLLSMQWIVANHKTGAPIQCR